MPASARSPPPPDVHPHKRARQSSPGPPDKDSPTSLPSATSPTEEHLLHDGGSGGGGAGKTTGQSSGFRNVSACNRCRLRKNRCDQKLPSCASCEKVGVACVGYDPITKREIPRSYIFYLETRVEQLEALLSANNVAFPAAENLEYCSKRGNGSSGGAVRSPTEAGSSTMSDLAESAVGGGGGVKAEGGDGDTGQLQKLVTKPGFSGMPGAANPRHLGGASGVTFARVVFAAVQSSVSDQRSTSDKGGIRPYKSIAGNGPAAAAAAAGAEAGTSMRDSFFGLHTKPTIQPAPFPERSVGKKLMTLYFEYANPQLPVLHRGEFLEVFEAAYAEEGRKRGPSELYMLNMVFAIGGAIILGEGGKSDDELKQAQPEEYHASAIVHLESCLGNSGGLEELQAVLLLANFALLRPVPPGLWYIIGVAVRLAVDLGLHYEDGKDVESSFGGATSQQSEETMAQLRGHREWMRDRRRRLWWCTYSFDRLVSVCVGRPFGISDQVITTEFPSLLEDRFISKYGGLQEPPADMLRPTYKLIAHHYFRLRLLQSEILQVLQFQQTQTARAGGLNQRNPHMHTTLPSPFLSKFDSFRSWRIDIDKRLYEWKNSAPTKQDTGVSFSTEFFDLNYWQAVIMLYRQSLSVPDVFEQEYHTSKEVDSPTMYSMELREDEDRVYLKVAEAGQKILRLYRQLHLIGLVNYTYLATHHLFMAGISYLYAIWHSPIVRSRLTMDEVDFTVLAATSVFTDLMEKCPPAEACRDAFDRTVKATVKMANSRGGFGQSLKPRADRPRHQDYRMDWSDPRADSASQLSISSSKRQHHHRNSIDQLAAAAAAASDLSSVSDAYSNSASSLSQLSAFAKQSQQKQQFRLKNEPSDSSGFSMMRNLPLPPRSNASAGSGVENSNAVGSQVGTPEAIDPSLMGSPVIGQMSSPIVGMAPPVFPQQQQQQQADAVFGFGDLQGMDFLQGLDGSGGAGLDGGDFAMGDQMDLGFGLGWQGLHHDFSDGQQVDLFDGFFFGGQQGNGGAGMGGGL
ncbi:fungal-specific transcription factor domain-containing protein [Cercophora newfieldiana]|uniref:Fungal-specific transcription factor domain-containing protein n=1 Tax=Cercophora newfieldiana TaxID=92897 RepID=A0AA39Y1W6_9PEZI|nr:fungal-specific transcription factor domain-containing protein [Cercophora newfieldiana]